MRFFRPASAAVLLCGAAVRGFAASSIEVPQVRPATITAGSSTPVLVTAVIADPKLIAGSVFLLRVNETGTIPIGTLHDDGVNGDEVAGDRIFSIRVTFADPVGTRVQLRITAAFRGVLARTQADLPTIFVQAANAVEQTLGNIADAISAGDISTALNSFSPSPRNAEMLSSLDAQDRATFAQALRKLLCTKADNDLATCKGTWTRADGSATDLELMLLPSDGQWIITNW
jgi:hypothetical protein